LGYFYFYFVFAQVEVLATLSNTATLKYVASFRNILQVFCIFACSAL